ncbi:hypothetical protein TCAL_01844 [Tigriopus californicus]|uniref:Transcription initiation factor TFIID subunit 10 n=1 Tax=Tigriopus californicus TaxID=6832 RepID=A0A553NFT0_TIGCA|nr:transcription initiation factor TFIID subunit 10-like [Tigriopus californicus]TRY64312.1 hypothetical protein TCAL_01844 [Tigriopus californicus]|eukprot:TCALIF_01844-PA protein Name:"Similar to Taf10 Transcription initiation factor TFIID subunit 10 (Mus musculus)" AED:0.33 eAED:0.33 QI:0/-1/0/1/-1/1/1/0/135
MASNSQNGRQTNGMMANGGYGSDSTSLPSIAGPPVADLVSQLEDYTPTIPDAVAQHFLSSSGFQTDDPRIVRIMSIAAQKFVADIANDALQHCKMRGAGQTNKKNKDRKYVLTNDDLAQAMSDQGITLKKPPYFM